MKRRTKVTVRLEDIKISKRFDRTPPSLEKLIKCDAAYRFYGIHDRDIVLDENRMLIDGFVLYTVLKYYKVHQVDVLIEEKLDESYRDEPTVYIYGQHPGDESRKEYVWRCPPPICGVCHGVEMRVGQPIKANTKKGLATIIIRRIVVDVVCPVPKGQYVDTVVLEN